MRVSNEERLRRKAAMDQEDYEAASALQRATQAQMVIMPSIKIALLPESS